MATFNIPDLNQTGLDSALIGVSSAVPIFAPGLLLFTFAIIFITLYNKQRLEGQVDIPQDAVVASIVTSIVGLILSMTLGIINPLTLTSSFIVTILCGIWFLASGERQ